MAGKDVLTKIADGVMGREDYHWKKGQIMAKCNAFYGEPMPDSIFFCCQLEKGHSGRHNFRNGEIEVFWDRDDRLEYFSRMRERPIGHRFMRSDFRVNIIPEWCPKNKWIKAPTHNGYWWMLYMGCAQSVSCQPVHIFMIEGKPCVGKLKKNGKFKWIPIEEKYKDHSGFMLLGWQEDPEPYFNPDDY